MANKVGPLIKEARTGAKLTQEQLAKKITGLTAADISKAERGEIELSQAQLKAIAKATGVTQASLLNAAKEGSKPSAARKTAAKKPAAKLTAAEKKLVELYRAADKNTKEAALKVLKGEKTTADGILGSILGGAVDLLSGKK